MFVDPKGFRNRRAIDHQRHKQSRVATLSFARAITPLYLGNDMDISVGVIAAGPTSDREVAELTDELREAVSRLNGVSSADSVEAATPGGAKGVGQILGAFIVNLPAGIVPGIIEVLKSVAARPAQPPVTIELTTGSAKVSFDPKQIKPSDLAVLCEALRPKTASG